MSPPAVKFSPAPVITTKRTPSSLGELREEVRELAARRQRHAVHLRRVVERDRRDPAASSRSTRKPS